MNKQIIYTNKDNEDFQLNRHSQKINDKTDYGDCLEFVICGGNSHFYLLSAKEVDEFCDLLQEMKKEIWK